MRCTNSLFIALLASLFISCSNSTTQAPAEETAPEVYSRTETPVAKQQTSYIINKSNGEYFASLNFSGDAGTIIIDGQTFTTDISSGSKQYFSEQRFLTRIKDNGPAFKLKTESGELLWKIKIYEDKIKISNNEENLNPYEIKYKSDRKAKLYKNGKEIGNIKLKEGKNICNISGPESFSIACERLSPSLLVTACSDIPVKLRLVIVTELLSRGL